MVAVAWRPDPFRLERRTAVVPDGMTIAEIVRHLGLPEEHTVAEIGGEPIPRARWRVVRPNPGAPLTLHVVPGDSGAARAVLSIGIMIAAAFAAPYVAAAVMGTTVQAVSTTAVSVATAAISGVGMLALNALIPPPELDLSTGGRKSQAWSIERAMNAPQPYGRVPLVLGRHRITPPLAAQSLHIVRGEHTDLALLLCWGLGPVQVEDIRVGETPLPGDWDHVFHDGSGGPLSPQVYPGDVYVEALSQQLQIGTPIVRRTAPNTSRATILLKFPAGMFGVGKDGKLNFRKAQIQVEWSPAGQNSWTVVNFDNTGIQAGAITGSASDPWLLLRRKVRSLFRHGIEIIFPSPGEYDLRLTLLSGSASDVRIEWEAVQSWQATDKPLAPAGVAVSEIVARASEDWTGALNRISGVVTTVCRDWDGNAWIERATTNPASLALEVLTGRGNRMSVPDSRIDLDAFADWHDWCAQQGLSCGFVVDTDMTVWEALRAVAAAGRAVVMPVDGLWRPVIDRPRPVPVQLFTPRNIRSFSWRRQLVKPVHALRVHFVSEPDGWTRQERYVYADGYDETNAGEIEDLELPAITDPSLAHRFARWRLAELALRRDTWEFEADVDALACAVGDRVLISHDAMLTGRLPGRVVEVIEDASGVHGVRLDGWATFETGKTWRMRIRHAGDIVAVDVIPRGSKADTFDFTSPLPPGSVERGDLAVVGEKGFETVDGIVKSIVPVDDDVVRLVIVPYDERIYDADTEPIPAWEPRTPALPGLSWPQIDRVAAAEHVGASASGRPLARTWAILTPIGERPLQSLSGIEVRWREAGTGEPWQTVAASSDASRVAIGVLELGATIELQARWRGADGTPWPWSPLAKHNVAADVATPADVLQVWIDGDELIWRMPEGADPAGWLVRWTRQPGSAWDSAVPAHDGLLRTPRWRIVGVPRDQDVEFLVRAVSRDGALSPNARRVRWSPVVPSRDYVVLHQRSLRAEGWPVSMLGGQIEQDGTLKSLPTGAAFPEPLDAPAAPEPVTDPMFGDAYAPFDMSFDVTPSIADAGIPLAEGDVLIVRVEGTWERLDLRYRRGFSDTVPFSDGNFFSDGHGFVPDYVGAYFLPWPGRVAAVDGETLRFWMTAEGVIDDVKVEIASPRRHASFEVQDDGITPAEITWPEGARKILTVAASTPTIGGWPQATVDPAGVIRVELFDSSGVRISGVVHVTVEYV